MKSSKTLYSLAVLCCAVRDIDAFRLRETLDPQCSQEWYRKTWVLFVIQHGMYWRRRPTRHNSISRGWQNRVTGETSLDDRGTVQ